MFHVYVEGVTGAEPDAVRTLSEAMAARYGLSAAEIYARLSRGRFRVKANVDQATADEYARDLEAVGARVGIERARANGSSSYSMLRPEPPSLPSPSSRSEKSSLAPPSSRSERSSLPPPSSRPEKASLPPPSSRSEKPSLLPPSSRSEKPSLLPPSSRSEKSSLLPPSSRSEKPSLPAQHTPRPMRSSLPLQPASPRPGPLETEAASRPVRSSLPPQPASRASQSSLSPQPASQRSSSSPDPAAAPQSASQRSSSSLDPAAAPQSASRRSSSSLDPAAAPQSGSRRSSSSPGLPGPAWEPGIETTGGSGGSHAGHAGESDVELGALGRGVLSLGALDASALDEASIERGPWSSVPSSPASIGPATLVPRPPRPDNAPLDLFAPPEEEAEAAVELAPDEIAHRARKQKVTPPAAREPPSLPPLSPPHARRAAPSPSLGQPALRSSWSGATDARSGAAPGSAIDARAGVAPGSAIDARSGSAIDAALGAPLGATAGGLLEPAPRRSAWPLGSSAQSTPSPQRRGAPGSVAASLSRVVAALADRLLRPPRTRFVTGVFLAIALGYIPAGIVGSLQETSAFRAIDAQVVAVQAAVDSTQSYDALDAFRADRLAAKHSARRRAVITSMLVWVAASGGLASAWVFARRSGSRPRPRRSPSPRAE